MVTSVDNKNDRIVTFAAGKMVDSTESIATRLSDKGHETLHV